MLFLFRFAGTIQDADFLQEVVHNGCLRGYFNGIQFCSKDCEKKHCRDTEIFVDGPDQLVSGEDKQYFN